jgi:hypothetical protein
MHALTHSNVSQGSSVAFGSVSTENVDGKLIARATAFAARLARAGSRFADEPRLIQHINSNPVDPALPPLNAHISSKTFNRLQNLYCRPTLKPGKGTSHFSRRGLCRAHPWLALEIHSAHGTEARSAVYYSDVSTRACARCILSEIAHRAAQDSAVHLLAE